MPHQNCLSDGETALETPTLSVTFRNRQSDIHTHFTQPLATFPSYFIIYTTINVTFTLYEGQLFTPPFSVAVRNSYRHFCLLT